MKKRLNLSFLFVLCCSIALSAQSNEEWGIASYYHDSFHGKETAYGVKYNKKSLTAAHRELPYGTMVRVTRLDNNKSVVVKVTDKGPYKRGRVVDLSRAAAERIGLIRDGLTEVKIEVVKRGTGKANTDKKKSSSRKERQASAPSNYDNVSRDRIVTDAGNAPAKPAKTTSKSSKKSTATATQSKGRTNKAPAPAKLVGKEFQKYGLYKISIQKPGEKGFAVQVASLTNYENVFKQVTDLQEKWFDNILISIEEGTRMPAYKILLGPFKEEAAAENYRKNLMKKHKIKGFVVDLNAVEYNSDQ